MSTEFKVTKIEWTEIHSMDKEEIKKTITWKEKLKVESKPGIYAYVAHEPINYPFGKSRIFYIGKSNNLASRLARHFNADMKSRLLEDKPTLEWFYQNYKLKEIPFDIIWTECEKGKIEEIERLLIGLFSAKYGAMPLCNSSIQRKRLKETYKTYRKTGKLEEVEKFFLDVDSIIT